MSIINMTKFFILIFSFTLIPGTVNSATWLDKSGNVIPDSPGQKSSKNFIAQLVLTDNETLLLKNWNTPSKGVYLPTTNIIEIGKILSAFIVFGGCVTDGFGNCDLVVKFTIIQPDGKVYADLPLMEVWSDKPIPPNNNLGLSVDYVRVIIEPDEQLGEYKVGAEVTDRRGGDSVNLSATFNAIEKK
jgi:hypothetical protein